MSAAPPLSWASPPSPTGEQYELRLGDQTAVVTEVGAALRLYTVGGRDVVMPFGVDEPSPAVHGGVLVPWPNRIRDGRYTFDGVEYRLALTEPERHNAIHGLGSYARWQCLEHTRRSVTLRLDIVPQPGYPFSVRVDLRYELGEGGLTVTARATNLGATAAPYGIGFHPWLSPGAHRIDDCTVQVDAAAWVRSDERLLPLEEVADIPGDLDFRAPRPLGATMLDDAYVASYVAHAETPDDRSRVRSWVRMIDPDDIEVACWLEEGLRCWQLCTGDGMPGARARGGLAAEPLSCTADAFNTGRRLTRLEPGRSHTARYGLTLTRH